MSAEPGGGVTVTELALPDDLTSPDAADFIAMTELRNAIDVAERGAGADAITPEEMLARWATPRLTGSRLIAKTGGRLVARGNLQIWEGSAAALISVEVLPDARGRGIGGQLWERLVDAAHDARLSTLQSVTTASAAEWSTSEERIATGDGASSMVRNAGGRFLEKRGLKPELVLRLSELRLPPDPGALAQAHAAASPFAADYRFESWIGATPETLLAGVAELRTQIARDAPSGDADLSQSDWTAEQVREHDLRFDGARTLVTTAATHIPSDRLVGYTQFEVPRADEAAVDQADTIVLNEHRGHRLGMLLKLANLELLQREHPGHPRVMTQNAEQNRPMLDVNERVGFAPVAYDAIWQGESAMRPLSH